MLCERPSGKTVPPGINENVLFVLDNEENATWQASGQRACYADDCGTWSGKASSKTHHYIMSEENDLAYVDKKDGQFVKFTKGERVVVDPQPVNNVIVFKRYYISLKRDPSFKRRISVVAECPDELSHVKRVAVVEYIGNYPQNNAPHGNSKNIIGDYVRTACAVKRKIEDMVEARKTPRAIYEDMVLDSSNYAPRDLKQVQNAKYAAGKKRERTTKETTICKTRRTRYKPCYLTFTNIHSSKKSCRRKESHQPLYCTLKRILKTLNNSALPMRETQVFLA